LFVQAFSARGLKVANTLEDGGFECTRKHLR